MRQWEVDAANRAEVLCDRHNELGELETGNGRETDIWHVIQAFRVLAKRDGFSLAQVIESAMNEPIGG